MFGERQFDFFRDVLLRLIESAEPDMLTPLSMILCGQTSAPKDVSVFSHQTAISAATAAIKLMMLSTESCRLQAETGFNMKSALEAASAHMHNSSGKPTTPATEARMTSRIVKSAADGVTGASILKLAAK